MGGTPKSKKRFAESELSPSPKRTKNITAKSPKGNQATGEKLGTGTEKTTIRSKKVKSEVVANGVVKTEVTTTEVEIQGTSGDPKKAKRTRKTTTKVTETKEMIPAVRTLGSKILVGAHVSAAGGAHNAIENSLKIGGNAFALFLKNQKQWAFKPLLDEVKVQFLDGCKHHNYASSKDSHAPIVPHGSYLVNLAHVDKAREEQAYTSFIDDLARCDNLGISLYNFHPGNAGGAPTRSEALQQLARQINKAHRDETSGKVITLLETMASVGGNVIGSTFDEIAEIIAMVEDKDRVGVCMDTCHVFAAGYDLRTPEAFSETMEKFDTIIGLKYLKALHINDSKAPLGSGRDLHANLGLGFLGLGSFWNIVNDKRLWGLPFILETPGGWSQEIKLLESLVGMDRSSDLFKELESNFSALGKESRDEIQGQVDRRANKSPKKRKKKIKVEESEDDIE